jgi:hypothetical protein
MTSGTVRTGFLKHLPFLCVLGCLLGGGPVAAAARSFPATQTSWLVADFDGDNRPDLITLHTSRSESAKTIGSPRLQSGSFDAAIFTLANRFPTQRLRARDLDGDSDRDIVLETTSSVAIAVWINDGAGHFARGNLDDFRAQLGPADSAYFSAEIVPLPDDLTDENPIIEADPHPVVSRLLPLGANLARAPAEHFSVSVFSSLTTRGPPRNF